MFFLPLAVAAGSAIAGANAAKAAGKDSGAGATLDQAIQGIQDINAPTLQDLTYRLDNLVQQGIISPDQAKAFLVNKSAAEDMSVDPRLRAAQMDALSSLQDISRSGGMTAMDKAKVGDILSKTEGEAKGAREAIFQNAAERGQSGSGIELAKLLGGAQDAATRASHQGTDVAATAEQRALDAITKEGTLGGQMEGQQFGEEAQKAAAKDAIAQFNATHLQSTDAANVAARNAAQEANLAEKQRVADTNAQTTGQNRAIAAGASQTVFQNSMDKQKAISDALTAKANAEVERQKQKAAAAGGMLGTVGAVGSSLLSKSDEKSKNVSRETPDMDAFMAALKPLAFKYKDPGSPGAAEGDNVGVIAQDVEKTPVGKTMVKNTPDGKMLDIQKGFGVILAALAALHDKIEGDKEPAHG